MIGSDAENRLDHDIESFRSSFGDWEADEFQGYLSWKRQVELEPSDKEVAEIERQGEEMEK